MVAAAIGGLVAASPFVGAESPAPDRSQHLLVVPNDAEGAAALAASDVRTVARYPEFTLVEARGEDDAALRDSGADRRDDMRRVTLAGDPVDPLARESLAAKGADLASEELVLVQFVGPVKDGWLERLGATGGEVIGYVAQNGYLVHAAGDEVEQLAALVGTDPAVRAITPVRPGDKIEGLGSGGLAAVQTVAGEAGEEARSAVADAGGEVRQESTVKGVSTQYVRLSSAEAAALGEDPAVLLVEPYSHPEPHDERASQIAAGNLTGGVPSGPSYLSWLTSHGFTNTTFNFAIDVTDSGFDNGSAAAPAHADFYVNGTKPGTSRMSYVNDYSADNDAGVDDPSPPVTNKAKQDCSGHGTNVATIAAGYNAQGGTGNTFNDASGFNYGLGVAPHARVGVSKIFDCADVFSFGSTFTTLAANAHAAGARISNNSWGTTSLGLYNADSRTFDSLVRDARPDLAGNQELVEVVSAGNSGSHQSWNPPDEVAGNEGYASIEAPGTAKNVITVGASEGVRPGFTDGCNNLSADADNAGDVADFSSRGPTDDLRLKPDLVAPGTHVVGARPTHDAYFDGLSPQRERIICNPIFPAGSLYNLVSGTSQAAPVVSGAAALVRDWYPRKVGGLPPSPALTKAILVDSATDVGGGDDGKSSEPLPPAPSMEAGWGRLNLRNAFNGTQRAYVDQTELLTASGTSAFRDYDVPDSGTPVRVTLVWTDAVPAVAAPNAFVNDLDLTVTAGGRGYLGNVMAGGVSLPGGAPDTRNNVESVVLPAGAAERLSVEVGATSISGDGVPGNGDPTDQDFALVVSNATAAEAPILSTGPTAVNDGGTGGDGDSILESDEQAKLVPTVENSGTAPATSVTGALSGAPGFAITAPGTSTFPDIAPDGAADADAGFEASFSAASSCGTDAIGTLSIDVGGDADSQTVPVIVPTGAMGPAVDTDAVAPNVPKAIPDDDPAGVSSSVFVAERGQVKDVNVRIGGITHAWVGDLAITLTGPDGTTVTLARHPGGPDNGADNFSGVIFNDEATGYIAAGASPVSGSVKPQGDQLSRFDGKGRRGTWTLRVRDLFDGLSGSLTSWGLTSHKAVCDVDTTPPTLSLTGFPGSPVNDTSATFVFTSPDVVQGGDSRFECRLDGGVYTPCTSAKTYSSLGHGLHQFWVQAIDGSGNESPEQHHSWVVDTVPPQTSVTSGPAGFVSTAGGSMEFSSELDATFECSLDGVPFAPCSSPHSLPSLTEGPHTFRVRATDLAGNMDPTPAVRSWTIDTIAPSPEVTAPISITQDRTPLLRGTGDHGSSDTSAVTVELFEGPTATGSPVETYPLTIDGSGNWVVQAGPLALGQYTVRASQTDQAGNPGVGTRTFTVVDDDVAPGVTLRTPAMGSTTRDATPLLSGLAGTADGDEPTVAVRLYHGTLSGGLPAHTLVAPISPADGSFSVDSAALTDGTWTVVAQQLDSAGNAGASFPVTFTVSPSSPPPPPPPAAVPPSLIVAPGEADLGAAVKSGLSVLTSCATDCSASARLSASGRDAAKLGLRAPKNGSATQAVELGRGSAVLMGGDSTRLRVRLSRQAKNALKKLRARASLKLLVTIREEGGAQTKLDRSVSLVRSGGLGRAVSRGYPVLVACSERCALAGDLSVSRGEARRLKLPGVGSGRLKVASGKATGGTTAKRVALRVPKKLKSTLRRAARVSARLSVLARDDSRAERQVRLSVRLAR